MAHVPYSSPPVRLPSIKKTKELSQRIGIDLSEEEVAEYRDLMKDIIGCYNEIEKLPEITLPVKYPRLPGYRPTAEENPLNAWYWKTNISGAPKGILRGKRIVMKDTIAVSGVPMMGGSWVMEGYVPEFDATVVTRVLDAGGTVAGKALCEDWCVSGVSFLAAKGPTLNPHNNRHSAGGSSSGCAVLVAKGEVDMAIGGDQGGSVRLPASCCGIIGLKPTHGLVPYTGAQALDPTVDHLGPMARNVKDCALLLEAIAGYDDGLDQRQSPTIVEEKYTDALKFKTLDNITIGLLKEGFEQDNSEQVVNELVRTALQKITKMKATVTDVSVPLHKQGFGSGHKGFYSISMMDAVGRGIQSQADDLPPPVKSAWMLGEYMKHEYRGRFYGKAQNLRRLLRAEFDKVFQEVDVIAMPTIPFRTPELQRKGASISDGTYSSPPVRLPSLKKTKELAQRIGIDLSQEEVAEYRDLMKDIIGCYNEIEKLPEITLPVKYPRLPGYRPTAAENPFNAWYWKTDIKGASEGLLQGKRIAMKDTIAVSGVPMMGGSWVMEGYVPEFDATVVTRVLDAGGTVAGKAVCEDWCVSGVSYMAAKGPTLNPCAYTHSAGGSSSGCAVLVAKGEVDMAIGGDQGGSIRLPASCCGIIGLKPTHGLVPYTGAQAMEPTNDHLGPMAKNVKDCALLLESIAGYDDGLDQRQNPTIVGEKYSDSVECENLKNITIGLLKEGFEQQDCDDRVNSIVKSAVSKMSTLLLAKIVDVSVPLHNQGKNIRWCMAHQGISDTMLRGGCVGSGHKGFYSTSMMDAVGRGLQSQPDDLSPAVKRVWMLGEYMKHEYRGRFYGKAQNLRRLLTAEYDKVFQKVDVIAMPTIPFKTPKLPAKNTSVSALLKEAGRNLANTSPFNATGHPALTINAGFIDGLPVGMMLVGRMFDEKTLLKVAYAYEQLQQYTVFP
ncbi:amidase-like isoform X2 [Antedon mediterranea]|uniref:amidase-like isoform X2 n=1 Tax=Antedon mediterranea TaxID=105859 RepID=UPI003AF47CA1